MHAPTAEEVMGAALDVGIHDDLLEQFLEEFEATEWVRVANRAYPPCYAYALGRFRAHPAAIARMRKAISTIPRVDPSKYDILFNVEGSHPFLPGPTWDIVKWMRIPEMIGWLPGLGWCAAVLEEPYPIMGVAADRAPLSLSERDFDILRKNATTMREGGKGISREMLQNNLARQAQNRAIREAEDLEFAEYYRDLFKREAEELGI